MQRSVIFKADQDGLVILLNDETNFKRVKSELDDKLKQGGNFFTGNVIVKVKLGNRCLSIQQKKELLEIFKRQSGSFVLEFDNNFKTDISNDEEIDTLLLKKTIRSGQSINYEGNVVVEGDINPGGEVIAGGDILVMGEVRGITHAGSNGDIDSTISAFRLDPLQLRIANYIGRAPDESLHSPNEAEIAFVKEEKIVIDYLK
ncbi:septum site-determining protein MinC [Halanaerocella petrolearia]